MRWLGGDHPNYVSLPGSDRNSMTQEHLVEPPAKRGEGEITGKRINPRNDKAHLIQMARHQDLRRIARAAFLQDDRTNLVMHDFVGVLRTMPPEDRGWLAFKPGGSEGL